MIKKLIQIPIDSAKSLEFNRVRGVLVNEMLDSAGVLLTKPLILGFKIQKYISNTRAINRVKDSYP